MIEVAGRRIANPLNQEVVSIRGIVPGEFVVNVVVLFQQFFQSFGAMACLLAALAWHARVTGRGERTAPAGGGDGG